jgi:hypothetical protein
MGLEYQYYFGDVVGANNYYNYNARQNRKYDVSGYDAMIMVNHYGRDGAVDTLAVKGQPLYIKRDDDKRLLVQLPGGETATFDVTDFSTKLNAKYGFGMPTDNDMIYYATQGNYRFKLQFTNISGKMDDDRFALDGYDAYLLVGIK